MCQRKTRCHTAIADCAIQDCTRSSCFARIVFGQRLGTRTNLKRVTTQYRMLWHRLTMTHHCIMRDAAPQWPTNAGASRSVAPELLQSCTNGDHINYRSAAEPGTLHDHAFACFGSTCKCDMRERVPLGRDSYPELSFQKQELFRMRSQQHECDVGAWL